MEILRFGIKGCETVITCLDRIVQKCAEQGFKKVEMGIAHRGRLSIFHSILKEPLGAICQELSGTNNTFHVKLIFHN